MHSVYIDQAGAVDKRVAMTPEESRHALRVLRLRENDEVTVIDARGNRFSAVIEYADGEAARVWLTGALESNEPPVRVTLYQGLPKADKLEFIVQKATELGAVRVVPVKMERCVAKADEKDGRKKRERMEKIALEAVKQCKRSVVPEIAEPLTWKQTLARLQAHELVLIPWEDARGLGMKDIYQMYPQARDIGIVIGPEGGMSTSEIDAMTALNEAGLNIKSIALGPRILRAETAALASVTMAMLLWGDL